jgi:peptidoglycan/LPS O-acetylase OafA/YrhL
MFPRRVKTPFIRFKTLLPWLMLLLLFLSAVETAIAYSVGGRVWPIGGDQTKLSSALFSTAFVLCFVAFDRLKMPFNRTVSKLGAHSYGLYLSHYPVLGIIAEVIERITPWVASRGWLLLPLLFILTVTLSRGLMEGVARLPTRRFYRYLFG